jgi:hypothetical protein
LAYNWKNDCRGWVNGKWLSVPGPAPQKEAFRKIKLTEGGMIACLPDWDDKSVFLRR